MVIFPLTFIANTFVPAENLPTPLRIFAEWNPVSAVTQAARELFGNIPPGRNEGCEPGRPEGGTRTNRVVASEPGALHDHLGHRHPVSVRSAGRASIQEGEPQDLRGTWSGADAMEITLQTQMTRMTSSMNRNTVRVPCGDNVPATQKVDDLFVSIDLTGDVAYVPRLQLHAALARDPRVDAELLVAMGAHAQVAMGGAPKGHQ